MAIKRQAAPSIPEPNWTELVRPLCAADLARVQSALSEIAPDWSAELHGFCAEEATLILVPEDGDDHRGPSFVISREAGGIRLDQVRWDTLTEVGTFASLHDVITAIGPRLAFCGVVAMPGSATLH